MVGTGIFSIFGAVCRISGNHTIILNPHHFIDQQNEWMKIYLKKNHGQWELSFGTTKLEMLALYQKLFSGKKLR
jgi:hypothetical protein